MFLWIGRIRMTSASAGSSRGETCVSRRACSWPGRSWRQPPRTSPPAAPFSAWNCPRRLWICSRPSSCRRGAGCTCRPRSAGAGPVRPAWESSFRPSWIRKASADPLEDVEGDVAADERALVLLHAERGRLERHVGARSDHDRARRHLGVAVLQELHRAPLAALRQEVLRERLRLARVPGRGAGIHGRIQALPTDLHLLDLDPGRRRRAGGLPDGRGRASEARGEPADRGLHRSPTASTPVKRWTPVESPAGPSSKLVRSERRGNAPNDCSIRRRSRPETPYRVLPRLAQSKYTPQAGGGAASLSSACCSVRRAPMPSRSVK